MKSIRFVCIFLLACASYAGTKTLTLQDIMRFKHINDVVIAHDGSWIAYTAEMDRGNPEGVVRATTGSTRYRVERGSKPIVSANGSHVIMTLVSDAAALEVMDKKEKKKLKTGAVLLNTASGEQETFERVKSFDFSDDGQWVAILFHPDEPKKEDKPEGEAEKEKPKDKKKKEEVGGRLLLRKLASGHEIEQNHVRNFAFSGKGGYVAYSVAAPEGSGNGLFMRHLAGDHSTQITVQQQDQTAYTQLTWDKEDRALAWLRAQIEEDVDKQRRQNQLFTWEAAKGNTTQVSLPAADTYLANSSTLKWTKDAQRLFFQVRPLDRMPKAKEDKKDKPKAEDVDLYDIDSLLDKRGLDVWHGEDPRIKPNERKWWERNLKSGWQTVYHMRSGKAVTLADASLEDVEFTDNPELALGRNSAPYLKQRTWQSSHADFYMVDLKSGKRTLLVENNKAWSLDMSVSPDGRFLAWYENGEFVLYTVRNGNKQVVSAGVDVSFEREYHDVPTKPSGYGFAGWIDDSSAFMVYDRFDIWVFPTKSGSPYMLTGGSGRDNKLRYRLVETDEDRLDYKTNEQVLLHAYYEEAKNHAFYRAVIGKDYVERRIEDKKKFDFVVKAKRADTVIFTREDFREFPDLWVADTAINQPRRLTNENPGIDEYSWGKPELIEWKNLDGVEHQGVLIKPGNYKEGTRVPVLVYYYEFFSQRMYEFNKMRINHRPNFPYYTSNGYAVFLPDVKFTIGQPGYSATKSLVPGVQKIIEMGVADPDAIGLHGHSWSGYQTAFVVTQTNTFKAAVAGAPVSNMTSAYSGIRLGSGLARQFQYEKQQSRIGENMWERRDLYIENSPVFFADRIETPMLIQFGDIDEAVPWQQGIEMYLAMRRLDKEVVFLQYHDEPHHLKKYGNKLDYTIKMKEWFDHYLKGEPAPDWMTRGVPYKGE